MKLKKFITKLGSENLNGLIDLKIADFIGKPEGSDDKLFEINSFRNRIEHIINRGDPLTVRDLAVNGKDVLALGIREGQEVGRILEALLEKVLKNPDDNHKEILLEYARKEIYR